MDNQENKLMLALLAYAAQRDVMPSELCSECGIVLQQLQSGDKTLMPGDVNCIWQHAVHVTGDRLFGLHFGESLQLAALGTAGEIIKTSATVGDALTIAAAMVPFVAPAFTMQVVRAEDDFTVVFNMQGVKAAPAAAMQTLDMLMVFTIHELDGLLLTKVKPQRVRYAQALTNPYEYERVMRCKVLANTGSNSITFAGKYWDEPVIAANFRLQQTLLQQAGLLTAGESKHGLQAKIYTHLLSNSYLGIASLEDIAANFNTTTRTLQRKLKQEGSSFQQLADDARKTLAVAYLAKGKHAVKEVSYMLGYNELSAFARAFKRWTGTTPAAFKKQPPVN